MNRSQKREVLATLIKAGRKDLARQFVRAAEWNEYASNADDHLNGALGQLRNLQGDSKYGKLAVQWEKAVKQVISEISQATRKFGGSDTPA